MGRATEDSSSVAQATREARAQAKALQVQAPAQAQALQVQAQAQARAQAAGEAQVHAPTQQAQSSAQEQQAPAQEPQVQAQVQPQQVQVQAQQAATEAHGEEEQLRALYVVEVEANEPFFARAMYDSTREYSSVNSHCLILSYLPFQQRACRWAPREGSLRSMDRWHKAESPC